MCLKFPVESLLAYKVLHNIDKRRVFYFLVYDSSDGKQFKICGMLQRQWGVMGSVPEFIASRNKNKKSWSVIAAVFLQGHN